MSLQQKSMRSTTKGKKKEEKDRVKPYAIGAENGLENLSKDELVLE